MRLTVVLSMLSVVVCAPLGETEQPLEVNDIDNEEIRVKRAKEIMMFGNQQNEITNDVSKRIDPAIDENGQEDKGGLIVATDAIDLPEESTESESSAETDDTVSEEVGSIVNENQESGEMNEEATNDTSEDDEVPMDNTEVAVADQDDTEDEMSFDDYLKELEKVQGKGAYESDYLSSLLPSPYRAWQPQPYGLFNYPSYGGKFGRYRRSQLRTFNGYPYQATRMLKRGHRAKRQTYDPEDFGVYFPYDTPYNYPDDEDLAELLDLLDPPTPYEDDRYGSPYDVYSPYEEPSELEFESPKRQAGLTFVPGIKRSRDFYPVFEEPGTHFSAFIPEKRSMREYADAYRRVMELAAELRQQEEGYPSDYFESYRRRK